MMATTRETTTPEAPLVSVVVVYYRRRDSIEESIKSVLSQDYPNLELIVVDNHSEDGLRELVKNRKYKAQVIELAENRGACGGRNAGFAAARGEIIVALEDDVSFRSPKEVSQMVAVFRNHPQYHVLAFQICDPETGELRTREWCHPRYWKEYGYREFETHWFGEGASAFRREVLQACGGYYEPFFYGAEGDDFVIRILNHGYRILYTPQVRVGHRASQNGRSSERQYYYFTRNYIWTTYKSYYFLDGMLYLLPKLVMMGLFTIRTGSFSPFLRGLWDGIRGLGQVRKHRSPATRQTVHYLAALERQRPNLLIRLARHKAAPQL